MKSSGIGGQAVLEGVMMKYKSDYAVATRKPDGGINVIHGKCKSIAEKSVFFRLPIIRGIINFIESLVLGMKTLTYSADFFEEEEDKASQDGNNKENSQDSGDNGNIEDNIKEKKESNNSFGIVLTVVFSILLAIGIFMVLPFFLSQLLHSAVESPTILALIEGLIRIVLFIGYVLAISMVQDIKRVFMYHGAEHKSINCVESGLELTVENVRKQSKHHKRCGTSFLLIVMFISIVCFMFIHFENVWLRLLSRVLLVPVIAGVSYEFIRIAGNTDNKIISFLSKPGMLLQRLTTREPDDKMIEVAIASVEEVFDWEAYQRWCRSEKARREEKAKAGSVKKSRAQIREELLERERENKQRATERARQIQEMEKKEAELEKIAEEARKRKEARKAITLQTDVQDETLTGLDHFLDLSGEAGTDSQKTQEVDNVKSINAQGMDTGNESTVKKSGAKVINLSDYK